MKRCLACHAQFASPDWTCPTCGYAPTVVDGFPVFAPALSIENDSYEEGFFHRLAELEKGHFWFEARNQLLYWAVQRYFPNCRSLFEVGCGTGFVLQHFAAHLPGVDLHASDILTAGLGFAAQRVPTASLIQMDAGDIPFRAAFDVVGAFDVIEHIADDETALAELFATVKPGGGLLISVPQHRFLWSVVDDLSFHKRRYTRADLLAKIERAGFQVIDTTSFVALLLPVMLMTRAGKAKPRADFDIYAEFELNPAVNAVLTQVMRLEVALIRLGLRFPMGGSRLVVARRPA